MSDFRWQEECEQEQYEMTVKLIKKVAGHLSWSEQNFLCYLTGMNPKAVGLKDFTHRPWIPPSNTTTGESQ